MTKKNIIYLSIIFIVIGSIFLVNGLILAWDPPTESPPAGNVDTPLNVGTIDQYKSAGLGSNSMLTGALRLVPRASATCGSTNEGTIYYDTDDMVYICKNSAWNEYRGPTGATGATGATGPQGPPGPAGSWRLVRCICNPNPGCCIPNCGAGWTLRGQISVSSYAYWTEVGICEAN